MRLTQKITLAGGRLLPRVMKRGEGVFEVVLIRNQARFEIRRGQGGSGKVYRVVCPRRMDHVSFDPFIFVIPHYRTRSQLLLAAVAALLDFPGQNEV